MGFLKIFAALILTFSFSLHGEEVLPLNNTPAMPNSAEYYKLVKNKYSLFAHKRSYILPFSYNWHPHNQIYESITSRENKKDPFYENEEMEFQISFFVPVYREVLKSKWDLIFAYTHRAWWQLYNSEWSRPFRETNYMPELFFRKIDDTPAKVSEFTLMAYDLGFFHQSNGQIQELSRSWNRFFARLYVSNPDVMASLTAWFEIPDGPASDNPDIRRYLGIGELSISKAFGRHTLEFRMPLAVRPGIELQYSYPWHDGLRVFVSGNYGYGPSLIEYNHRTERIGVGFTLQGFMDQQLKDQ